MAFGSASIQGLDVVVRDFTRAADRVQPDAERLVVDHAGKLADRMRSIVPVDEGDVLDSITSDVGSSTDDGGVWAEAGPDTEANRQAFVARFLEDGTSKMSPRPFVHPAAEMILGDFAEAVRDLPKL